MESEMESIPNSKEKEKGRVQRVLSGKERGRMSEIKLKPCPFCGGEAEAVYAPNDINRWGVQCKSCGCTVEVEDWKGVEDTRENVIKAWNRRAGNESRTDKERNEARQRESL